MRKTIIFIFALIAIFACGCMTAFAADEKVGFVDDMAILQQFPKFKQAQDQLSAISKKKSDAAKAAFDKETDQKKKSQIVQNLQLDMNGEESRLMAPVLKEVNDTISKVAKAKGVTIVLNKVLVYYGGVDLTQDVITALKR
jgi:outer membrane protein